jgi:hypothetical protein
LSRASSRYVSLEVNFGFNGIGFVSGGGFDIDSEIQVGPLIKMESH